MRCRLAVSRLAMIVKTLEWLDSWAYTRLLCDGCSRASVSCAWTAQRLSRLPWWKYDHAIKLTPTADHDAYSISCVGSAISRNTTTKTTRKYFAPIHIPPMDMEFIELLLVIWLDGSKNNFIHLRICKNLVMRLNFVCIKLPFLLY